MSLRLLQGGSDEPEPAAMEEYRISDDGRYATAKDGHVLHLIDLGIYSADPGSRLWVLR